MKKSTGSISLVLIGSSLFLAACGNKESCSQRGPDGQPLRSCSGGAHFIPVGGTGGGGKQGVVADPNGGTVRGGFGSHGPDSGGHAIS